MRVSVLIAGGAVALEAWLRPRGLRIALMAAIVAIGLISAPFALPILPIEPFAAYQRALGVVPHPEQEHGDIGLVSEYYADMFGWRELAAQVAEVYRALPADEQKEAVFLGNNYGEAAAIDVLGRPFGLPPAVGQRPQQLLPVGATGPWYSRRAQVWLAVRYARRRTPRARRRPRSRPPPAPA
jgi:hypothetical protein